MMDPASLDILMRDERLGAIDKACYLLIDLRADATGGYYLGLRYIARILHIKWSTVRRAVDRLVAEKYLAAVHPGLPAMFWQVMHPGPDDMGNTTARPRRKVSSTARGQSPQEAPRMAMPPDLASEIIRYLAVVRHQIDTAMLSESGAISSELRTQWLAESDHLGDLIETFAHWLTRFGGGIPESIRPDVES